MAKRKLPAKLTASQVATRVDRLFNSRPMQAYHNAMLTYRKNILMTLVPELPESFKEGLNVFMPLSDGLDVVLALLGKAHGFVRYTDMVAKADRTGVPSQKLVQMADRGGRSLTVMNATMDPAKRKSHDMWGRQLVDGWTVIQLHRRSRPGNGFGFEAEVCDGRTCAFPEETGGAFVPKRLARRMTLQLSALQASYWGKGDLSKKDGGGFIWAPLAAPRAFDEGSAMGGGSGSDGEGTDPEVQLLTYDDGCYIYHVVRQGTIGSPSTNQQAEMLYCERNTAYTPRQDATDDYACDNGAMAVVVPGDVLSFGGDGEKMLPVLFSVMNIVNNLNLITSIRGRIALAYRPDMIVTLDVTPDEFEALKKLGAIEPTQGPPTGGAGISYIAGKGAKVTPWQVIANDDLREMYNGMVVSLDKSIAKLLINTDPEVVSQAPATNYHISTGEQGQRHTGWLGASADAWAMLDQMIINDMVNVEDEYSFVATDTYPVANAKDVQKGAYMELTPDDVDFNYDITVSIKQETEDQKNKRMINALYLRDQRVRTHIGVVGEDTVDVTARVVELFEDALRTVITPVILPRYVVPAIDAAIKTGAGFDFALRAEDFLPPQQQASTPTNQPTQTFAPSPPQGSGGDSSFGGLNA